ncbi:IS21-like element helper ATPase IstB [Cysteiniphilum sp. JM-1]|jgi:DNA replication protein DnaC|uniref:IS21-like element helper ATPase IstB n=1 Tax=Cysteiniphilum sp. JM-1 TaxID=2610891 RepID=UPI0012467CAC|nr:IS21-like element helper ATPase IstB [Cysteiniphilum sp. JM-1]
MHTYEATLDLQLKALKLASFKQNWQAISQLSIQKNWSHGQYLSYLAQMELDSRESSRLSRHIKESKLPKHKTLSSFNFKEIPTVNAEQINALAETDTWLSEANNIIIFGASGLGKTHLASAIAYRKIERGFKVRFYQTSHLVQILQLAKKQYRLQEEIAKLDKIPLLILDDIGYVKKDEHETSVLFELICQRYETGSLIITANQPFSQWDSIFPDNMMAVAAIDRLVHHATVISLEGESYRMKK